MFIKYFKTVCLMAFAMFFSGCVEISAESSIDKNGVVTSLGRFDFSKVIKHFGSQNPSLTKIFSQSVCDAFSPVSQNVSCKWLSQGVFELHTEQRQDSLVHTNIEKGIMTVDIVELFQKNIDLSNYINKTDTSLFESNSPLVPFDEQRRPIIEREGLKIDYIVNFPGKIVRVNDVAFEQDTHQLHLTQDDFYQQHYMVEVEVGQ